MAGEREEHVVEVGPPQPDVEHLHVVGGQQPQRLGEDAPAVDGDRVSVAVRGRSGVIVAAVRALDDAGVAVDDVGLRRPTLDDVFLTLTGRVVEGADDTGDEA